MKCEKANIPKYLHAEGKPILQSKHFKSIHKIFRLDPHGSTIDNPLLIEPAWINALSCNWSKLIRTEHVPIIKSEVGENFYYTFAYKIFRYKLIKTLKDGEEYDGVHVLSCRFKHKPEPCDYSHIEILINHKIYKEGNSIPFFDKTYSYEDWASKTALLKKKKSRFFKDLKSQYRLDMLRIFSNNKKDIGLFKESVCFLKCCFDL